ALRASGIGGGLASRHAETQASPGPEVTAIPPGPAVYAEEAASRDGSQPAGRVVFVGAGPGAPDLLTQRGARAIKDADIVIWASSLVDHRIVADHARPGAEIVDSAQLSMEQVLPYYQRAAHN